MQYLHPRFSTFTVRFLGSRSYLQAVYGGWLSIYTPFKVDASTLDVVYGDYMQKAIENEIIWSRYHPHSFASIKCGGTSPLALCMQAQQVAQLLSAAQKNCPRSTCFRYSSNVGDPVLNHAFIQNVHLLIPQPLHGGCHYGRLVSSIVTKSERKCTRDASAKRCPKSYDKE